VVVIVGAGPIGLAALVTAQLYSPSELWMVDLDQNRLDVAKKFGATKTFVSKPDLDKEIMKLTGGDGVDVAIEAVGVEATFDLCQRILKPGGHLANVGVHGKPVQLELEKLWIRNVTLATGLVNTSSTPRLLKMVRAGKLEPKKMATHRFALHDMMQAYDTFENAARERAIKVILHT
jgi:alcohol dehydrogenase